MIHFATVWWFLQTKHTLFFFHLFFSWRKTALQYCAGFCCEVTQSCLTLCDPMDHSLPGSSVHGIFQARLLEWAAISLLRGIFPTQGSNPGLLHCRQTLYHLSHQGSHTFKQQSLLKRFAKFSWFPMEISLSLTSSFSVSPNLANVF